MSRTTFVLFLGVAASLACASSSEPSGPKGMHGTWQVQDAVLDETAAGRGTCVLGAFEVTIDSSASGISISTPTGPSLVCINPSSVYSLTTYSGVNWVHTASDSLHAITLLTDGSSTNEAILLSWPDMAGDSIGGISLNVDNNNVLPPLGQGTWSATRK